MTNNKIATNSMAYPLSQSLHGMPGLIIIGSALSIWTRNIAIIVFVCSTILALIAKNISLRYSYHQGQMRKLITVDRRSDALRLPFLIAAIGLSHCCGRLACVLAMTSGWLTGIAKQ